MLFLTLIVIFIKKYVCCKRDYQAFLRYKGNDIPNVIIVTTKEELDFAVNFYEKNDIKSYLLLNI